MIHKHKVFTMGVTVLTVASLLAGCGSQEAGQKAPVAVNTYKVTAEDTPVRAEYSGTVIATDKVPVRAKISGRVVEKYVQGGQQVTAGQPLFRIDSREYDALNKEIEYQKLDNELHEKRIREANAQLEKKKAELEHIEEVRSERQKDLDLKKGELDEIVAETEKDEKALMDKSERYQKHIEPRWLRLYERIRNNAHNGLAVVCVERDACGGCFSKIPPQRQIDIRMHKKIISCEYCGRFLVDDSIKEKAEEIVKNDN